MNKKKMMFETIKERWKRIDIFVANAGMTKDQVIVRAKIMILMK